MNPNGRYGAVHCKNTPKKNMDSFRNFIIYYGCSTDNWVRSLPKEISIKDLGLSSG